jgi:cholesterol oxidase
VRPPFTRRRRSPAAPSATDFDVVVVGSGFGGSVSALRLTEKGYRVAVLEAGRRWADEDFPKTNWNTPDYLWAPEVGMLGIQRIRFFPDVTVLAGAGVGGGSLNYANTLYVPPAPFFADRQWAHITDWRTELAPYYDQAQRMLGVVDNPRVTQSDELMQRVAQRMGVPETYGPTRVGIHFGEPGREVADPYFGGAGPARGGCTSCGSCMTGCRVGAKNTLVKNYLYLAERGGATIVPETTVDRVVPRPGGGYELHTHVTGPRRRPGPTYTARDVVFAAGAMGTAELLHRMRTAGTLPEISDRLGELTRTNSESLVGAIQPRKAWKADPRRADLTDGAAITSSVHLDEHTHIEACRYGHGSNAMFGNVLVQFGGGGRIPRWARWLANTVRHPRRQLQLWNLRDASERGLFLLVMQTHDNSLRTRWKDGPRGGHLTTDSGEGPGTPDFIPQGNEAARVLADEMGGIPFSTLTELAGVPVTAHFIGGCAIGDSPRTGVIDPYQRVYGHAGLHVADGSALTANLGVNPSLTITAQAERAMAMWPNRGEVDPRPPLGEGYAPVAPVAPHAPLVPAHAPAALRLTAVAPDPGPVGDDAAPVAEPA